MYSNDTHNERPFSYAMLVQCDASRLGFDWPEITGVLDKVEEELAELRAALEQNDIVHAQSELGDLLFAAVSAARFLNADPEACLAKATQRFEDRLDIVKNIVEKQGMLLTSCTPEELDTLWEQAKKLKRQQLENDLDN